MQPKECGWARTANGKFADLGAGISYLGVFTFGLIRFRLAVYPDGDFSHLIVFFLSKFLMLFFWYGHSLQLNLISSALDIGEVSSIWFSLHLRNFSATENISIQ